MKTFEERRAERRAAKEADAVVEADLDTRRNTIAQQLSDDITKDFDGSVFVKLSGHHLALSRRGGGGETLDIWVDDEDRYRVGAAEKHVIMAPRDATRDEMLDFVDSVFGHA